MRIKPKILIDIKRFNNDKIFSNKDLRLDLRTQKSIKIPFFKFLRAGSLMATVFYLAFGSALAPVDRIQQSLAAQSDTERQQLESQLQSLESQIGQYQDTIDQYRSQGKSLQGEINKLNAQISKLNLQVRATNLSLTALNNEIDNNKNKISQTETDIEKNKKLLAYMVQDLYSSGNVGLLEVFLKNFALSDFFNDLKNLTDVQDSLRTTLENVINLKSDLLDEQTQLALQRDDATALKSYQISQAQVADGAKKEKSDLLTATKGQESKYQDLLKKTQETAAQIRSKIFKLLGGGELPFGDAVKIAQIAENATGVRAAFILAILTQESSVESVIGANLGKCYYNDPGRNSSGTVMSDSQKPAFLSIMSELGLDPRHTPISCPITSDGTYGGAMGPAQFMPNTWLLYRDKISSITGNKPASPFNNADAFTGTALYLQGSLASCKNIYKTIFSQENCAAAKYYAGAYWKSYMGVGRYGYRVADRASDFSDEIAVLNANN
ncbi:MAG: lytic murein transglycosylase [Patescibacteria group bacterium]|nr:lytic murein transglycosylase [Patescibacteria group bacterium]